MPKKKKNKKYLKKKKNMSAKWVKDGVVHINSIEIKLCFRK